MGPPILTKEVRLGLLFIVVVTALSFFAVASLLLYICYNAFRNRYSRNPAIEKWYFFRSHADYYFFSLLLSDFVSAIGSMMYSAWVVTDSRTVSGGTYCGVQAAIQHIGNVGMALATLVIAVHTFLVLVMQWRPPDDLRLPLGIVATIWVYLLCAFTIPGSVLDNYYGATLYWCGIEVRWIGLHLALEYSIYWITAIINICLYVPLFLYLRGNLKFGDGVVTPGSRVKFRIRWQWRTRTTASLTLRPPEEKNVQQWVARQMLAYPIAYLFIITPISVASWVDFVGKSVPYEATCFAAAVFASSGLVNTTLYLIIRPKLLQTLCGRRSLNTRHRTAREALAEGARRRVEMPYADEEHRNDKISHSCGLGVVSEQSDDPEEESSYGIMKDGPLRNTWSPLVISAGSSRLPETSIDAHVSSAARGTSTSGSWVTSRAIV
ncbi:hypothetical protein FRB99_001703 [Tulasnella sp. 403]|nr:hypothetical protein FRB99_001703 [Tulasnella sp. 403]